MAGAQSQLDAIGADHLLNRDIGHSLRSGLLEPGFQALAGAHIGQAQIQPVVMTCPAILELQSVQTGSKGLSTLHQCFEHQHRGEQRIPFRQMHTEAHAAGFLSTDQHLIGQHFGSDVLETHGQFTNLATLAFGHPTHQI